MAARAVIFKEILRNFVKAVANPKVPFMRFETLRFVRTFAKFEDVNSSSAFAAFRKRFDTIRKLDSTSVCRRKVKNWALYAGLLSFFGLAKEEISARQRITDSIKMAILAQKKGQASEAEQILHLALKSAQEIQDPEAITYIYDVMANLALENGQLEKAELLFKNTAQRLFNDGMREDDNAFLEISIKLANIYSQAGKLAEAESGYVYCLQHLDRKVIGERMDDEDTILLYAMCADAYGRHLMGLAEYQEATRYFSKALEACKRVMGVAHPQALVLLNNLGSATGMMGRFEEAVQYMQTAIDIARDAHLDELVTYYCNLAFLYLQMRRFSDAESCCSKALEESRQKTEFRQEATSCLETVHRAMNFKQASSPS